MPLWTDRLWPARLSVLGLAGSLVAGCAPVALAPQPPNALPAAPLPAAQPPQPPQPPQPGPSTRPAAAPVPTPAQALLAATQRLLAHQAQTAELPAPEFSRALARAEAVSAANLPPPAAALAAAPAAALAAAPTPGPTPRTLIGSPAPAAQAPVGAAPDSATHTAAATLELALMLAQARRSGDLARAVALTEALALGDAGAGAAAGVADGVAAGVAAGVVPGVVPGGAPDTGAAPPWQALAQLLLPGLQAQRRLEDQAERQAQQLREQQRRIDQLGSQLQALKAIERSLNTRPPAPAATTPPATSGQPRVPR